MIPDTEPMRFYRTCERATWPINAASYDAWWDFANHLAQDKEPIFAEIARAWADLLAPEHLRPDKSYKRQYIHPFILAFGDPENKTLDEIVDAVVLGYVGLEAIPGDLLDRVAGGAYRGTYGKLVIRDRWGRAVRHMTHDEVRRHFCYARRPWPQAALDAMGAAEEETLTVDERIEKNRKDIASLFEAVHNLIRERD